MSNKKDKIKECIARKETSFGKMICKSLDLTFKKELNIFLVLAI